MINLTSEQTEYATFTPAVQDWFAEAALPAGIAATRCPAGLKSEDLNFLAPNPLFILKYALASYGLPGNRTGRACMIKKLGRPRNAVVIGDSGGFQAIKGLLGTIDAVLCRDVLRWQEQHCDVGIVLDVPTAAISEPKSGFTSFEQCRDQTVKNVTWAADNRKSSDLRLLNILQGRNGDEADNWYRAVRAFPLEGWAWGGPLKFDLYEVCRRIIIMLDNGDLTGRSAWLHFLGVQQPTMAVVLTALKRALRAKGLANLELTFDCATAFVSAAQRRQATIGLSYDGKFNLDTFLFEHTSTLDPAIRFPFRSPLGERLTQGDLFGVPTGVGRTWDEAGRVLLAHHNVYATLRGIADANRLIDYDEKLPRFVPHDVRKAVKAIHAVFESDQPMAILQKHKKTLKFLAGSADVNDDH
ncbi:hypothetical protein J2848_005719 [Azospirillum lipoferum]|uniref:Uncharacterized protein n=1 Tax=Azospirillum lipoferum TaxID=193 RepID=A0A5A9GEH5_AZOLI|nr:MULTISPECIES: hypothetical protein [Azospirillum]KAA0592928.1 hypothetical protein FZ942_25720 [Azospirillum lipoferum]MCP1614018.1 hypothetical protein [Azospirillum lipoferum]MDW5537591.1 hypothetical protein [Azospirillum sp. NL1]